MIPGEIFVTSGCFREKSDRGLAASMRVVWPPPFFVELFPFAMISPPLKPQIKFMILEKMGKQESIDD